MAVSIDFVSLVVTRFVFEFQAGNNGATGLQLVFNLYTAGEALETNKVFA